MTDQRLNVVFVDDEPSVLDGLRRQLRANRQVWDVRFAASGEAALRLLDARPADIVVSDMKMPGMNGGEVLRHVLASHPQTVRMILSGQTDAADLYKYLGFIHQYLQKPCDPGQLCAAIERTFRLVRRLSGPELRLAAGRVTTLPPCTRSYRLLVDAVCREDATTAGVGEIVAGDPGLSLKLMHLVNSAFFGMPRKTNTPQEAVVLLGLRTVRALVVAGRIFDSLADPAAAARGGIDRLWEAGVAIGQTAARVSRERQADPAVQQQARLAGMLSLVGRAILLTSAPAGSAEALASARARGEPLGEAERLRFGASQDDVSAYALGLWGFADGVTEAVASQSHPSRCPPAVTGSDVAAYVHLARSLQPPSPDGLVDRVTADVPYLAAKGLDRYLPAEARVAA